jgi:hypothetical protein
MPCVAHTCLQRRVAVVEVRLMRIHTIQECFLCIRVYTTVQLSLYTDGVVGRLTLRVPNETAQQSGGRRGPAKVLEPDREARHPTRLVGRSYEWSGRPVHAQRQDTDRSVPMAPSHGQDSAIPHPPRRAVARWRRGPCPGPCAPRRYLAIRIHEPWTMMTPLSSFVPGCVHVTWYHQVAGVHWIANHGL